MNRWRKQTRVNGVVVETLRLRSITTSGDVRGVILSLEVTHTKAGATLTIEIDGEAPLANTSELTALKEAERLLQEAIALLEPPASFGALPPPTLKSLSASTPTSDVPQAGLAESY